MRVKKQLIQKSHRLRKITPNILFLIQLPPPVHGSSLIGKRIKESFIINNNINATFINTLTSRNMAELGKKPIIKLYRFFSVFSKFLNCILINRYDLCVFAITSKGAAFYRDLFYIFFLKLFRVKYLLLMNNKGVSSVHHIFYYNLLYKYLFKDTQIIINSEHIYPDIQKYVSRTNIHILFNGIPEMTVSEIIKPINEIPRLLYLGNMTRSKGVFVLLEACRLLNEKGLEFRCDFVGAWEDINEKDFADFIDSNELSKKVYYLGPKYGNEKLKTYKETDIFVFPTYYHFECFPLVLLEAMQNSLPIVSTPEGGILDIVDHNKNGFLVQQKDEEELALKLELLIMNEKLRQEMGQEARKKYELEFTLEIFERNLISILMKSLEQ